MPSAIWRKKRRIIRHYDRLASTYDTLYKEEQDRKIEHILSHIQLKGSDLVLDAGCGTGFLFRHIYKQVSNLIGVDLSNGLLRVALQHVKTYGMESVSLIRADVDHLPFKQNVFDNVFALTLLQNSATINITVQEILRTAKNGSTVVLTGLKKGFSKKRFIQTLRKERLTFNMIPAPASVKDYLALCSIDHKAKNK
ncbi:methyltransferase domain-containing protein [Candidatus Bathyarchaeota archaeon]|nr:methyltransferase domain-containing protein [Candidatus Bathyarchaeota archaeon]